MNPTTTDREGFDAKKFLVDFYAYIHTSNPEGKTALVDYDTWAARLEIALKEEHQRTLNKAREVMEKLRLFQTICGNCNLNGDLCRECYANRRANSTIDAILSELEADITSKEGEK